jgi:hypothetical protein
MSNNLWNAMQLKFALTSGEHGIVYRRTIYDFDRTTACLWEMPIPKTPIMGEIHVIDKDKKVTPIHQ